jgi:hypothetical protein
LNKPLSVASNGLVLIHLSKMHGQMNIKFNEGLLLSGLANSQDRVKLEEQDHISQHHTCTSASLQLHNSQMVKKRNSEDRSKNERASTY